MPGRVTFAVGDVHGRLDLLRPLVGAIKAHPAAGDSRTVFLGDYVDRGPDSRGVVELMLQLDEDPRVVCLQGNHEEMMVRACGPSPAGVQAWLDNGGDATVRSYGADPEAEFRDAIPEAHLRWLGNRPFTSGDPHRIYVHAGLKPATSFEAQKPRTFLWIREAFLEAGPEGFERHVVHGHTPIWTGKPDPARPELLEHRTNLDTGAFQTGTLMAGVFAEDRPGGPVELITVSAGVEGGPASVRVSPVERAPALRPQRAGKRLWSRLVGA